ncbi:HNH endonuclease [Enterobacter cloacae]|uniref:HNH endonuclease n=1 Tax=Enterobacter cloacae TaxID=550 RepID=UPI002003AF54|nr:HNH endonuclease [Enterobacter cloacae]MCK7175991.1 HNH endonuclease [Enterobacter cloacae]
MKIELANEYFKYDRASGKLYWKKTKGRSASGKEAGWTRRDGYRCIFINGKTYFTHRLIWLLETGEHPSFFIDHINGDCGDNRFANLRMATHQQNGQNCKTYSNNNSGAKNVNWSKSANSWRVSLSMNKKIKHIGYFKDFELASLVAEEAREKYHGEFSRHF